MSPAAQEPVHPHAAGPQDIGLAPPFRPAVGTDLPVPVPVEGSAELPGPATVVPALVEPPRTLPPGPQTLAPSGYEASPAGPISRSGTGSGTDLVSSEASIVKKWPMRSAVGPGNISSSTIGPGSAAPLGRAPVGRAPIGRAEVQRRTADAAQEPALVSSTEPVLSTPAPSSPEVLEKRSFRLRVGAPINPSSEPQIEGVDGGPASASDSAATDGPAPGSSGS